MLAPLSPTIETLSPDLASQIAAGEVVERPASVVKELIENALDAGACRIDVTIEAGGLGLIEVADDGHGMSSQDAPLCLGRHATSKLRRFEDLQELRSYGFRGEALPSVASVSRLEIRTRRRDSDEGVLVLAAGTIAPQLSPVGHPVGTTIKVSDLFFNVPARRKFLRSSNTESGHVAEVVVDAALSNPQVSFSLMRDKRRVKQFPRAEQRRTRAEQVFVEADLWQVSGTRGPLTMDAYLCPPERSQKGAAGLKLLINGRPIRDRALSATIAHAFGSLLERGRYPRGVVYLEMPARLVDVNVHPQKTEVRFAEQRAVTDAIYGLVARGASNKWIPDGPRSSPATAERAAVRRPAGEGGWATPLRPLVDQQLGTRSPAASISSRRTGAGAGNEGNAPHSDASRSDASRSDASRSDAAHMDAAHMDAAHLDAAHMDAAKAPATEVSAAPAALMNGATASYAAPRRGLEARLLRDGPSPVSGSRYEALGLVARDRSESNSDTHPDGVELPIPKSWKSLRFLCQVRATYLMCEGPDGIYILDQHAADERVLFSCLKKSYETSGVASQALLFPLAVEVTPHETELLEQHVTEIQALGLDVRVRSQEAVSIHGAPKLLQRTSPDRILRDVLEELSRESPGKRAQAESVLSKMACHGALRGGDRLSPQEAEGLLKGLAAADFGSACPHGRPIVAITSFRDLERKVGRR